MAGEIHVYFHNTGSGEQDVSGIEAGTTKDGNQKQKVKDATNTKQAKDKNTADDSMIKSLIIDSAKKVALDSVSMIGDLSGNYQAQRNIENGINAVNTAVQLMNFPVGTVATSLNIVSSGIKEVINRNNENQQIALLKERSGNAVFDDKGTQQ